MASNVSINAKRLRASLPDVVRRGARRRDAVHRHLPEPARVPDRAAVDQQRSSPHDSPRTGIHRIAPARSGGPASGQKAADHDAALYGKR